MHFEWVHVWVIAASSLTAALIALGGLSLLQGPLGRRRARNSGLFVDDPSGTVMLFDQHDLIDASDAARLLLSVEERAGSTPWDRLLAFAVPRFPGFAERMERLTEVGRFTLAADGRRPLTLRAECRGGLARITLIDPLGDSGSATLDAISQRALEDELEVLRGTLDRAPLLAWRAAPDGSVVWANRAYLLLAAQRHPGGDPLGWPLPALFDDLPAPGADGVPAAPRRAAAFAPGDPQPHWYDCHVFPMGTDRLYFALPADATVQAETSLRSFIQTLTKTFAHLTVGLAIFDRRRQLALFNPALIDLTALSPEFLSARPTLPAFLDTMRESQMIPEPKDYKSWRTQMAVLEKAAASGQYEEIWTLPSGQTYRVTGRPHPDGAIAFLFEDISAEMTLTRRFRAELELSQAVIDTMGEAIAVFSPAGMLILSNSAYASLWETDAGTTLSDTGIVEATVHWQSRCAPSPIWSEIRDFVGTVGRREGWTGEARLSDGRLLVCRFAPLAGGATLIGFSLDRPSGDRSKRAIGGGAQQRSA